LRQAALFEVVKCLCGKDEDLRREVARCVRAGDYDWLTLFCDHPEAVIGLFRTYQEWANHEVGQKLKFTYLQTPTWSTD
jgi:hypothetical protein